MLKKEKNFIIYEKEENKVYKLDFSKGVWYGIKGQELVSTPPLFKSEIVSYNDNDILIKCIKETVNWNYKNCKQATTEYTENMTMLDKLINFLATIDKILYPTYINNSDIEILRRNDCLKKYTKELIEELAKIADKSIRVRTIVNLVSDIEKNKVVTQYKLNVEDKVLLGYDDEWAKKFVKDVLYEVQYYPKVTEWILKNSNNMNKAIYWLLREYQYTPDGRNNVYDFISDLDHLRRYIEPFEKTLSDIDKHNFISQYIQYNRDYQANKDKFDNEKLAKIDYSKWFFEDDEYITVFPKSKQDFITEGQKQNNCVGGYYNYVIENHRVVTFIRRKNDIDKPLVTCDIYFANGCRPYINQFLKAHNNYVRQSDGTLYEFYNKYINYIQNLSN